jgi:predicted nucleotidyltransferase component of viral defense system
MKLPHELLRQEAEKTGFRPEILEKVYCLLTLLKSIHEHPYLNSRLALKGGTALNLFYFNLPRLSIDIDLNYIGSVEKEIMLAERPQIEAGIQQIAQHHNFQQDRNASSYAGGKYLLTYDSMRGNRANLQIDLNFMHRQPLMPVTERTTPLLGIFPETVYSNVLDIHEITGSKIVALLSRHKGRDLVDCALLAEYPGFDAAILRQNFVTYAAINRNDPATLTVDHVFFENKELKNQLIPMLSQKALNQFSDKHWAVELKEKSLQLLNKVLPLREAEKEFLDRCFKHNELKPELITEDAEFQQKILRHPGFQWNKQVKQIYSVTEQAQQATENIPSPKFQKLLIQYVAMKSEQARLVDAMYTARDSEDRAVREAGEQQAIDNLQAVRRYTRESILEPAIQAELEKLNAISSNAQHISERGGFKAVHARMGAGEFNEDDIKAVVACLKDDSLSARHSRNQKQSRDRGGRSY